MVNFDKCGYSVGKVAVWLALASGYSLAELAVWLTLASEVTL